MEVATKYNLSENELQFWKHIRNFNSIGKNKVEYEDARILFFKILKSEMLNEIKPIYDFTEDNIPVITNLIKYFINDESSKYDLKKGIWLFGNYGSGKTFLFKCIQKFCNEIGLNQFSTYYCKEFAIEMSVKSNYTQLFNFTTNSACFDDMMSEPKGKNFGTYIDTLDYVLTTRYRTGIKTHATSNKTPDDLINFYDETIESRAHSLFNFQALISKVDYRKW